MIAPTRPPLTRRTPSPPAGEGWGGGYWHEDWEIEQWMALQQPNDKLPV